VLYAELDDGSRIEERLVRIVFIAFAVACLGSSAAEAAPWCAHFNTGLNECHFYSFRQCSIAVAGVGGYCSQNAFERATPRGYDARRRYRWDY
jgi:hypothetical protein